MPADVILIGLDGVPPETLFDTAFASRMPVLTRLREQGSSAPLRSTIPAITVPAWAAAMTSRDPGELGVYGFRNRVDHGYGPLRVASSANITEAAVWDVLGQRGRASVIIGLPPGYPPRAIRGDWIGCLLTPDTSAAYTWPQELRYEVEGVTGGYVFDIEGFRTVDRAVLLEQLRTMLRKRWRLARHLLATRDVALFVLHEIGTDRIHHGFWKDYDPRHPRHDPDTPFREAIIDYYALVDEELGELLSICPDAKVVIASDHGCQTMRGGVLLNQWLIDQGHLALRVRPERPMPLAGEMVDWGRTRAWAAGGYYGRVWLNVRGREPEGQVASADAERVLRELGAAIEAIPDELGRPLRTRVFRPADTYAAVEGVAPDLMVYFDDLRWRAAATVGAAGWHASENDTGPDDANHSQDGIVVLPAGARPVTRAAQLIDLGPTLLELLGETAPREFRGTSLV